MKKFALILLSIVCIKYVQAQQSSNLWKSVNDSEVTLTGERTIIPIKYKTFHIIENNLKTVLFSAPNEKNTTLVNSTTIIELPMPDGTFQEFRVVESPTMAPELAAKFPNIKTFNVKSKNEQAVYGKLDWNDFGFHAMLRTPAGDIFIDPYCRNNTTDYITYYASDFKKDPAKVSPEIGVIKTEKKEKKKENSVTNSEKNLRTMICAGNNLRTYRLAVACTGEYAQAATGLSSPSISQILSAIVTTVNRVDGVYETEVAVKLVLIANETDLLYANENTDPFTGNDDGDILIGESQIEIDYTIGDANYDIGHTFSTGGGGLANLGCVCQSTTKAGGITGSSYPVGDPYDIDYVAHEIGHQFNCEHTFTANTGFCAGNGNPATEVEPGSGVTIMSYAGICDYNDVASHSIPYFHTISFDEVMAFTTNGVGATCPTTTATGNAIPVVTATTTHTIPFSTPFTLSGTATDADSDPLTYQWEETDLGSDNDWNTGSAPYFRSYVPIVSTERMFPKLSVLLSGNYTDTIGEYLPSTPQTLNFRLIARDNKVGGGGVCYDNTQVIIANAGPFTVTNPNTQGIVWTSASSETVTWNVNGTNLSPINCANVDILISIDQGQTYTTLLANTTNDGSEVITVPNVSAVENDCRIQIRCNGNIFFDINNENFTINPISTGITSTFVGINNVKVHPNPFNSEFQLVANGLNNEKTNLKIYDILGNIILSDTFIGADSLNKKYNLTPLSKGVYVVELSNSNQKAISRLIKQ